MTPQGDDSGKNRVLFLSPEPPILGGGGGGMRSASLLEYLRAKYSVDVVSLCLRPHSRSLPARAWRNLSRLARDAAPLFDRYSGYEDQLRDHIRDHRYDFAVIEHFWCASYEPLLRTCSERVVLDLHNIESELAQTHARAARWPFSWASARFAQGYRRLEREWIPRFDLVLVASEEDRRRIRNAPAQACATRRTPAESCARGAKVWATCVYPNALPLVALPRIPEEHSIAFSGKLEYHPNVEAVRWFAQSVWPRIRECDAALEWRLIGRDPQVVERFVRGDSRVKLTGPVDDAIAEIARAKVSVVPLLSGSGTRFKILEAWAAGRAVVSTSLGAEGLGARHGEHLLLADDPGKFAEAVLALLADAEARRRLGEAGRRLYLENFTWSAAWRRLKEAGI